MVKKVMALGRYEMHNMADVFDCVHFITEKTNLYFTIFLSYKRAVVQQWFRGYSVFRGVN